METSPTGEVRVFGGATLNILDGASVSSGSSVLVYEDAALNISGGASVTSGKFVRVFGGATLNILDGSSMTSSNFVSVQNATVDISDGASITGPTTMFIADTAGAQGAVNVQGDGSIVDFNNINVGHGPGSNGLLKIESQGIARVGVLDIAVASGSTGRVIVSGKNSRIENTSGDVRRLWVGISG